MLMLKAQLTRDEGCRLKPYRDSIGKLTIGIGRNLDDVGISSEEAQVLLDNDITHATKQLSETFPWTDALDEIRRAVLINMAFNMGIHGLAEFRKMLAAVQEKRFEDAAEEMRASKWAGQVGRRAERLALQMMTGEWQ